MGLPGPIIEDNAGDLVFDLTADSCGSGSVRVVHFHIGDDDDRDGSCMSFPNGVRATIAEIPDETALETILLDSGADASVFPMSLMDAGTPISPYGTKLCDAQGKSIPIESMRLVEIRLPTSTGRSVVLKERVAISSKVSQPILCFWSKVWNRWSGTSSGAQRRPGEHPTSNAKPKHDSFGTCESFTSCS